MSGSAVHRPSDVARQDSSFLAFGLFSALGPVPRFLCHQYGSPATPALTTAAARTSDGVQDPAAALEPRPSSSHRHYGPMVPYSMRRTPLDPSALRVLASLSSARGRPVSTRTLHVADILLLLSRSTCVPRSSRVLLWRFCAAELRQCLPRMLVLSSVIPTKPRRNLLEHYPDALRHAAPRETTPFQPSSNRGSLGLQAIFIPRSYPVPCRGHSLALPSKAQLHFHFVRQHPPSASLADRTGPDCRLLHASTTTHPPIPICCDAILKARCTQLHQRTHLRPHRTVQETLPLEAVTTQAAAVGDTLCPVRPQLIPVIAHHRQRPRPLPAVLRWQSQGRWLLQIRVQVRADADETERDGCSGRVAGAGAGVGGEEQGEDDGGECERGRREGTGASWSSTGLGGAYPPPCSTSVHSCRIPHHALYVRVETPPAFSYTSHLIVPA
ncbi:hypothetical protein FB45DRAFT_1067558 [Roridomyces roridus]|uniref:Uncharacterized protein n=1 Tax=Roridomyces roridus TaxID=1738132 RepID=A0AAD7FAE7_9AGAR|nr:hypothetical protein FB45DRAFT_1067558 [Roridomyces roridus]